MSVHQHKDTNYSLLFRLKEAHTFTYKICIADEIWCSGLRLKLPETESDPFEIQNELLSISECDKLQNYYKIENVLFPLDSQGLPKANPHRHDSKW